MASFSGTPEAVFHQLMAEVQTSIMFAHIAARRAMQLCLERAGKDPDTAMREAEEAMAECLRDVIECAPEGTAKLLSVQLAAVEKAVARLAVEKPGLRLVPADETPSDPQRSDQE